MTGQIVRVALLGARHPYAYVWDGPNPLLVGEKVVVPAPPGRKNRAQSVGIVVGIGSDYPGPLAAIVVRAGDGSRLGTR